MGELGDHWTSGCAGSRLVESGCTWRKLVKCVYPEETGKVGVPEEDLAKRHICRRLVCIVQQGIASSKSNDQY